MAVLETIKYEAIHSVSTESMARPGAISDRFWIEFDGDTQNIQVFAGSQVSLETSEIGLNGVYRVQKTRISNAGYDEVQINIPINLDKGKIPLWRLNLDLSKINGKIYFGKRNVKTAEGGTATQVFNTDIFKVMIGLGVLIIGSMAAYSAFVKEESK